MLKYNNVTGITIDVYIADEVLQLKGIVSLNLSSTVGDFCQTLEFGEWWYLWSVMIMSRSIFILEALLVMSKSSIGTRR